MRRQRGPSSSLASFKTICSKIRTYFKGMGVRLIDQFNISGLLAGVNPLPAISSDGSQNLFRILLFGEIVISRVPRCNHIGRRAVLARQDQVSVAPNSIEWRSVYRISYQFNDSVRGVRYQLARATVESSLGIVLASNTNFPSGRLTIMSTKPVRSSASLRPRIV